jgi:hypothetical protein
MYINSHLGPCVCTQSPKYLEMAQGHISLSVIQFSLFGFVKFRVLKKKELIFFKIILGTKPE